MVAFISQNYSVSEALYLYCYHLYVEFHLSLICYRHQIEYVAIQEIGTDFAYFQRAITIRYFEYSYY
jgi:hypothetical protein